MTETHPLDLPFRGERTYLHGTDLHQAILAAVGERRPAGPVSITYHSLLRHQPDLVCSRDSLRELRDNPAFRGEIRFGTGTDVLHAALLESDRPVRARKPCNETEVVAAARLDAEDRSARLQQPQTGCPIEMLVFLNKHLHVRLLPELSPKWLFARLELTEALPAQPPQEVVVQLKQVLAGRFTRSELFLDGRRAGSISFSTPQ